LKGIFSKLWLTAAWLFCAAAVHAQDPLAVMDWKTEYSLNTYLTQLMHQQYDERREAFAKALLSREAAAAYVEDCRRKTLLLIGGLPPGSPLHPAIVGTRKMDGYSIEKITFESFKRHHVTANLYVPQGAGRFPAALLFCGHEDAAKATESYQKTAILFAKNGFLVLVIDPISQGERRQITGRAGEPLTRGGTTEHTLLNAGSNLAGTSTAAYELWDNVRALDYLVTRPEVDTSRIGCLGNSGGAVQAMYLSAFERRVKIAAVCSYLATRERTLELSGPADGCAQIPCEGELQMEMCDYLIAAAPNPLLVLAGRYDFIDYTGTLTACEELRRAYAALGQPERVSLFTCDDGHGISKPKREATVTWFRRWLCGDPTPVREPELRVLSETELLCTPGRQVNAHYSDEVTVWHRNLSLFDSLTQERQEFLRQGREEILKSVKELLSLGNTDVPVDIERVGDVESGGITWQKIIARRPNEVPLPLLVALPGAVPEKVVMWVDGRGKRVIADSAVLMHAYLQHNCAVVLCDVRGTGETADKPELNDPKFYNSEYRNAMLALHVGRPLVGQRARDISTAVDAIASDRRLAGLPLEVNASGVAALPALHALLVSGGVTRLNLHALPPSFKTILENPAAKNWYSYVIPGVLRRYDIPELVNLVGSKKVRFVTAASDTLRSP
jgi:dienelactone hydrolase